MGFFDKIKEMTGIGNATIEIVERTEQMGRGGAIRTVVNIKGGNREISANTLYIKLKEMEERRDSEGTLQTNTFERAVKELPMGGLKLAEGESIKLELYLDTPSEIKPTGGFTTYFVEVGLGTAGIDPNTTYPITITSELDKTAEEPDMEESGYEYGPRPASSHPEIAVGKDAIYTGTNFKVSKVDFTGRIVWVKEMGASRLSLSRDGSKLMASRRDNEIHILNTENGEQIGETIKCEFDFWQGSLWANNDTELILFGGGGDRPHKLNIESKTLTELGNFFIKDKRKDPKVILESFVSGSVIDPRSEDQMITVDHNNDTIQIVNTSEDKSIQEIKVRNPDKLSLTTTGDKILAKIQGQEKIALINLENGGIDLTIDNPAPQSSRTLDEDGKFDRFGYDSPASITPDFTKIAITDTLGRIWIIDAVKKEPMITLLAEHTKFAHDLFWISNDELCFTNSQMEVICINIQNIRLAKLNPVWEVKV